MKRFLVVAAIASAAYAGPAERAQLASAARAQVGVTRNYDPAYVRLRYPGGDVPMETGVCADVIVRAFRKIRVDLQVALHEDMRRNFSKYPRRWGLRGPDTNIDHRRVPNLQRFFERADAKVASTGPSAYLPGDLVTWMLPGNLPHIGVVSDRFVPGTSRPLMIHNIGAGPVEDDILLTYPMTGHYRYRVQ